MARGAGARVGAASPSARVAPPTSSSSSSSSSSRQTSHRRTTTTRRHASSGSDAPIASWIESLADRLPPRFPDAPDTYWRGAGSPTGNPQVHGEDSILDLLHASGAFHRPRLMVDEGGARRRVMLSLRTGTRTAGHPGWTHGGLTSLLMDEIAGQAFAHFVQPARGLGVTANLTVDYASPLPTAKDLLVVAGVGNVDGRKVWIDVEVRDGPPRDGDRPSGGDDTAGDDTAGDDTAGDDAAGDDGDGEVFARGSALFIVLAKD